MRTKRHKKLLKWSRSWGSTTRQIKVNHCLNQLKNLLWKSPTVPSTYLKCLLKPPCIQTPSPVIRYQSTVQQPPSTISAVEPSNSLRKTLKTFQWTRTKPQVFPKIIVLLKNKSIISKNLYTKWLKQWCNS